MTFLNSLILWGNAHLARELFFGRETKQTVQLVAFYTFSTLWLFWLFARAPWFREPTCAHDFVMDEWTQSVYAFQLSFYAVSLAFFNRHSAHYSRREYWTMLAHHFVTFFLLLASYAGREHRIGLVVLFIHDASDVLLYVTKYLHARGLERLTTLSFVGFAGVFFYARLYAFPRHVIYTCWHRLLFVEPSPWQWRAALPAALTLLQLMHVWWSALIVRKVWQVARARGATSRVEDPQAE